MRIKDREKENKKRGERREGEDSGEHRLPALLTHTHIATRLLSDADWFRLW